MGSLLYNILLFLQMGEITVQSHSEENHLMISDVLVDNSSNPTVIKVHVKKRKTCKFSGVDVYLGRTENDPWPVLALLAYIALKSTCMYQGPLYQKSAGIPRRDV